MKRYAVLCLVVVLCIFPLGCKKAVPLPGEVFTCGRVHSTVSPEAELTDFSCVIKPWNGAKTLHLNVTVRNISPRAQRYRVNIFLPDGKAVGGLLPRKIKKGLVQPGASVKFSYPVRGVASAPEDLDLIIKTLVL